MTQRRNTGIQHGATFFKFPITLTVNFTIKQNKTFFLSRGPEVMVTPLLGCWVSFQSHIFMKVCLRGLSQLEWLSLISRCQWHEAVEESGSRSVFALLWCRSITLSCHHPGRQSLLMTLMLIHCLCCWYKSIRANVFICYTCHASHLYLLGLTEFVRVMPKCFSKTYIKHMALDTYLQIPAHALWEKISFFLCEFMMIAKLYTDTDMCTSAEV